MQNNDVWTMIEYKNGWILTRKIAFLRNSSCWSVKALSPDLQKGNKMIDRFGKMLDNFGGEKAENGPSTTGSIVESLFTS